MVAALAAFAAASVGYDVPEMFRKRLEKSTRPSTNPIGGMMMSFTNDVTIRPNAAPMMMPTAISSTFPRMANSLNSFSMTDFLLHRDSSKLGPIPEYRWRASLANNKRLWQEP